MPEEVLAQMPNLMRWKGAKVGKTIFSSTAGTLSLTSERLVFNGVRGGLSIPLETIESCTMTGRLIKYLTVAYRGPKGTEHSTFGTQQYGMPSGEQWAAQIMQARDHRTGSGAPPADGGSSGPAPPAAGSAPHRPQPSADALDLFAAQGSAPRLLTWRVARTLPAEVVPPSLGRVEIWDGAVASGPIQYVHLAVGYRPDGTIRVIAAAEVMPEMHDSCYLGVFVDGIHHNLGADPAHADPTVFAARGVEVVLGVIDGQARAAERAAAPPPPAPPSPDLPRPPEPSTVTRDIPVVAPPTVWDVPAAAAPTTQDEMWARLAELASRAPSAAPAGAREARAALLRDAVEAWAGYGLTDSALDLLRSTAAAPDDPAALDRAAEILTHNDGAEIAAALLRAALDLGHRDPGTVLRLADALREAGDDAEAARVHDEHPWAVEVGAQTARGIACHEAAMRGDLDEVRSLLAGAPAASLPYEGDSVARLARADALGDPDDAVATAGSALRWWEAVLQGSVLLHSSRAGEDVMNGRYAAVWDRPDLFASVLGLLDAVLVEAGRSPTAVLAAPDRDSQVLGHALAARYGLGSAQPLAAGRLMHGSPLLVAYRWEDLGDWLEHVDSGAPDATLFAYSLDWTRTHTVAPDVVGLLAQVLYPLWDERMSMRDDPDAPNGRTITTIPADTRPPEVLGPELAGGRGAPDPDDLRPVLAVVRALRRATIRPGLLRGPRSPWYTGGPVDSNRF